MHPTQTGHGQQHDSMQILPDPVKAYIVQRLALRHAPAMIAEAVQANFGIGVDGAQVLACACGETAVPTLTGRLQNQESDDDEVTPSTLTARLQNQDFGDADDMAASPTLTARLQNQDFGDADDMAASSTLTPRLQNQDFGDADDMAAPPTLTARSQNQDFGYADDMAAPSTLTARLRSQDSDDADAVPPTLTGRLQNQESAGAMPKLTDEIKEFIVKSLARYDTPSQVAAAVRENFGIEVSRQRVYRYDPGNAQPPMRRWAELHAATRAAFLRQVAEIGVAHKTVRLAMLDRMANDALDRDDYAKVAKFLEQAAKECGGKFEGRKPIAMADCPKL